MIYNLQTTAISLTPKEPTIILIVWIVGDQLLAYYLPSVDADSAGRCLCRVYTAELADDRSGRADSGGVHSRTAAVAGGNSAWFRSTLIASSRHSSSPDDCNGHHDHITQQHHHNLSAYIKISAVKLIH